MEYQITNKKRTGIRVVVNLIILGCVFVAPFWITATLAILGALFFHRYYEIIFFGLLVDAVYLPEFSRAIIAWTTFSAIVVYLVILVIKPRLRLFV